MKLLFAVVVLGISIAFLGCITNSFLDPSSISDCENIKASSPELEINHKDSCFLTLAIKLNDVAICEKSSIESKDECFMTYARKTKEFQPCEKIKSENSGSIGICYSAVAILQQSDLLSACKLIKNDNTARNKCYKQVLNYAYQKIDQNSDPLIDINDCSQIPPDATTCFLITGCESKCNSRTEKCEWIPSEEYCQPKESCKEFCYFLIAKKNKNARDCGKITIDKIKALCDSEVLPLINNK